MKLTRAIRVSATALLARRVRAGLALASVGVGVAAVIVTGALGAGARKEVERRVERMGTNLLIVRPAQVQVLVARTSVRGTVTTLTPDDHEAIGAVAGVALAAPGVEGRGRIKAGAYATSASILGTTDAFPAIRNYTLAEGRFFDAEEALRAERVAVLGARVAQVLFPGASACGRTINVRGVPFEVVGVFASKGLAGDGSDEDGQVIVPVRTALRRLLNRSWLTEVLVRVTHTGDMDRVAAGIVTALQQRRGAAPADVDVQNTSRLLAFQRQAADSFELLTTGLGMLSLAVGGSGIIALMLLSVKERTVEIGLRVAVGARPRDILVQFLVESTALSLAGWLAGALAGAAGVAALGAATTWQVAVPVRAATASFVMTLVAGLGFGAIPATKAARLTPMEALLSR